ncbi:MAG: cyclase family protein [Planctomycetes bacterium]|nr:cyclase family protein [Planctomycetota bacterium]
MTRVIDISPLVSERIGIWPGDRAYRRRVSRRIEEGQGYTLSDVSTTVHLGAHADAPSHYVAGGAGIGERPLDLYYGPAQVIAVRVPPGQRIRPEDLNVPVRAARVLFRTDSFPDPERFRTDFNSLSPELVDSVHASGGVLVGIDTPSIDPFDDRSLLAHQAVARLDMAILEGLVLAHVAPGDYTLVALPLRLEGADASPVRAALLSPGRALT